ncbi:MAG: hypothetical protein IJ523_03520 [Succinivibrionaceae bacterium]|nr:hypothetical protein [Succinivibrionaceae bacterium]
MPHETGQTIHGDNACVFRQRPVNARKYPLIFLHGSGQSARARETTPTAGTAFRTFFLPVDTPPIWRIGKAGQSTTSPKCDPVANPDQFWFYNFRLYVRFEFFEGVQFAVNSKEALEQFLRQMTPNTGAYDPAVVKVFEKNGDGILVTHSQSGGAGWRVAKESPKAKVVISQEPGSALVFP